MPKQLADKFTFRYDALIDEIVGNCDGDLHGAIKALNVASGEGLTRSPRKVGTRRRPSTWATSRGFVVLVGILQLVGRRILFAAHGHGDSGSRHCKAGL